MPNTPPPNAQINEESNPGHYARNGVDPWFAYENGMMNTQEFSAYLAGNAIDYIWRHRKKGTPLADLRKSINYLSKLLDHYEKTGVTDTKSE